MSTRISSKEVLDYLNQLGYNNISTQQLKEFIYDLKKLIKHEERKRSKAIHNESRLDHESVREPRPDIFLNLHHQSTVASKAREVVKKESVISVQIKNPKHQVACPHHNKENAALSEIIPPNEDSKKNHVKGTEEMETDKIALKSAENRTSSRRSKCVKPKASFIRPTISRSSKSDPVALYHQYQAEWKRHKVPGEDSRTDLRWAIREKMSSGPRLRN